MARVNGREITRAKVDHYFNTQIQPGQKQPSEEEAATLRLNILNKLIEDEILKQRAEKEGLLATDDDVDRRLATMKSPYSDADFSKRLAEHHLTLDDLKQELRQATTIDKILNKEVSSHVVVTDDEVAAYYNSHKADFNVVESKYHLAHILVTATPLPNQHTLKNPKAMNDAEARRKIQQVLGKLEGGQEFDAVAREWSEDPESANSGGDLGIIPESGLNRTDAATRDAVLKLKPGQYSAIIPVKEVNGYHIVKLIDKVAAGQRDLNDPRVQQAVRDRLRQTAEQLRKTALLETLRNQSKVENYYAELILKQTAAGK